MSSAQDKKKLDHFMKLMKEGVDGMISLGHQAAAFYYLDDLMDSYGNHAMVSVVIDTEAVESHPQFHADTGALEILKLPTPPNLLELNYKPGKQFLAKWLPKLLGFFPGYGKDYKRPPWWSVQWAKSPQSSGTKKNGRLEDHCSHVQGI